jgi:3-oxoacyl-(acyl-carrier-protein) synthase/SAM-dependent methyltransferase/acyl carrier protein
MNGDDRAIAVVGMACRFPGAPDLDAFWELLRDGRDAIAAVPPERWDAASTGAPHAGLIEDIDQFDEAFFRIAPREAAGIDPQQRLLLEVAWEALESAGIPRDVFGGSKTGVFVGISTSDYSRIQGTNPARIDAWSGTGNAFSIAANRLSYAFDLRGPSIAVDTACSSSLVALHLARASLLSGESDAALAGGVNVLLSPELMLAFSAAHMLSPEGRCKTFDAGADGYVRGEGCGVVVLKRLADALRDGDPILALLHGSAVNQDGRSNGLTAPNGPAQEAVIRSALADAALEPERIGYVEAHGTATRLGDPIEVQALGAVLPGPCALGSVKTNIGHLEAAAGIAGVIKTVLALQHATIPASLHFREPNPDIPFATLGLHVAERAEPWPQGRYGAVSSFGFGGTNAHVIVGPAPGRPWTATPQARPHLLLLSAHTPEALARRAAALADVFAASAGDPARVGDIAFTCARRRTHLEHRLAVVAQDGLAFAEALRDVAAGTPRAAFVGRRPQRGAALAPIDPSSGDADALAEAGRAYAHGAELSSAAPTSDDARCVALPRYPWQHRTHWFDPLEAPAQTAGLPRLHPLGENAFSATLDERFAALREHRVGDEAAVPLAYGLVFARRALRTAALRDVEVRRLLEARLPLELRIEVNGERCMVREDGAGVWLEARAGATPEGRALDAVRADPDATLVTLDACRNWPELLTQAFLVFRRLSDDDALVPTGVAACWIDDGAVPREPVLVHVAARAQVGGAAGQLTVWDAHGRALVLLQDVAFRKRSAERTDPLYHIAWHALAPAPTAPRDLAERLSAIAAESDGDADFAAELDPICAAYAARAVDALGGAAVVEQERFRRLHARLRALAAAADRTLDPDERAIELARRRPENAAAASLVADCGGALADVLRGRRDPLDVLFPGGDGSRLAAVYRDAPAIRAVNAIAAHAVGAIARAQPPDRETTIAELGAGTGATTAAVVPLLAPERTRYLFTDVAPTFVSAAERTFADAPWIEPRLLDVERDARDQGCEEESVDVVVASNVLHATRDVAQALRNARALLVPGGFLVLAEITQPRAWLDLVFGLTEGWWRFADGRADGPLLSRDAWLAHLSDAGFEAVAAVASGDHTIFVARRAALVERPATAFVASDFAAPLRAAFERLPGFLRANDSGAPFVVITRDAYARPDPEALALSGLVRTLALERPSYAGGIIDLEGIGADEAEAAIAAALEHAAEPQIRVRADGISVPRIEQLALPRGRDAYRPDPEGSYLIAGGSGALGSAVAERLLRLGARHLVLAGRSGTIDPGLRARAGTDVTLRPAALDVADAGAVAALVRELACGARPLRGIVHAAGTFVTESLESAAWADVAPVVQAKLDGALALDRASTDLDLEFFVLFSSAAATFGQAGAASYAAANAGMNGVALARRARGRAALSLEWGPWSGLGMAERAGAERWADYGFRGLDRERALDLLFDLVAAQAELPPVVTVADIDWSRARRHLAFAGRSAWGGTPVHAAAGLGTAPAAVAPAAGANVREMVVQTVTRVLRLDPGRPLPTDRGLTELGLDSLTALEVRDALQLATGTALPATLTFEHPTIDALVAFLSRSHAVASGVVRDGGPAPAATTMAPVEPLPGELAPLLARLHALDDAAAWREIVEAGS